MDSGIRTAAASPSRVICVGGLDPGGGAGLLRDGFTAAALGADILAVGTAWTDQGAGGAAGFELREPGAVAAALRRALGAALPGRTAVKVGMVGAPAIVRAIENALEGFAGPVVFDPVLGASAGGALFSGEARDLLPLVHRATVLTPNLAEAAALLGLPAIDTVPLAQQAGRALRTLGAKAVLLKGGHLEGEATDVLVSAQGEQVFSAPRLPGASPRGTGCALATALAVALSRGETLPAAVAFAKAWLHERIRQARPVGAEWHLPY